MTSLSFRLMAVVVVAFTATAAAQPSSLVGCGTRLAEAEFAYREQVYEAAEALALDCAYTSRATPTERTRARRLLALTYMAAERPGEARLMVVRLVSADPGYAADPALESPSYVALVESVRQQLQGTVASDSVVSEPVASDPVVPEPVAAGVTRPGRVDVNMADAEALMTVPGIGPALAGRIIAHRQENGPFRRVSDLQNVRGIGERSIERMEPHVTTGGGEIRVASRPAQPTTRSVAARPAGQPININTASAEELEALPRIGPALAQRIIAFRNEYGAFRSVADLEEVRGIGPRTVEGLEAMATIE